MKIRNVLHAYDCGSYYIQDTIKSQHVILFTVTVAKIAQLVEQ